jgi:hypothetical protein
MTEDGGGGVQWLPSAGCAPGGAAVEAPGWLYALLPLRPGGGWQETVTRIGLSRQAEACARGTIPILTRWRLERLALPWREAADGRTGSVEVETLVSEHFGSPTVAASGAMERVFMARDLGAARWESWVNRRPGQEASPAALAPGSCPTLAYSEPPGPDWRMRACRTWTNFDRARPGAPVLRPLDWPSPELR